MARSCSFPLLIDLVLFQVAKQFSILKHVTCRGYQVYDFMLHFLAADDKDQSPVNQLDEYAQHPINERQLLAEFSRAKVSHMY